MLPLTNEDKKARSLCGLPIPVAGIDIHPLKLVDVLTIGENLYHYYLTTIVMLKKMMEIQSNLTAEELVEIDEFALLLYLAQHHPSFIQEIKRAIEYFLKPNRQIIFDVEKAKIFVYEIEEGERILVGYFDKNSYDEFIGVIKHQNHVGVDETEDERPADEATRILLEQRKKAREAVAKAKGEQGEKLSLADYISIINAKSLNVKADFLNVTVYSFYNYLERLMIIENYDVTLRQILAGVDPKKVKLKHWATKL